MTSCRADRQRSCSTTTCSSAKKPAEQRSSWAIPAAYFYAADVVDMVAALRPSSRGEPKITDVNRHYLGRGTLEVEVLPRGLCPEEVAWRDGWLDDEELRERAEPLVRSGYGRDLLQLFKRSKDV